ncbi:hypothetical protein L3Q82_001329 [Scortum barcoo]|uniref:Uncharacterized protein n=1 Tax=Scortum barcoo TaxID=214431 RepID=A0ACB8WA99_9TELE|nr:hypothetical protein L3Q82_001329 [Scortum barcoo]
MDLYQQERKKEVGEVTFQSCEFSSPPVPTMMLGGNWSYVRNMSSKTTRRGGPGKGGGEDPAKSTEQEDRTRPQVLSGSGFCKWFNVRMGFGFISMTSSEGSPVDPPLDVFVHQSKLVMEGFRSLKESEQVEFTYKKSSKGLESLRVTGPGGGPCAGSERRPKGKVPLQKRKPKGDRTKTVGMVA